MSRTLLIGLDGATFTILDPLMRSGVMPFLRDFVAGGVRAELLSTPNPLTPPAWTTLMTGRNPGSHGIFDFIRAEERGEEMYFTLYNSRDIRCETIWSIASRSGKRITSLNFPMMSPPPEVSGCVIAGMVSWKHLKRAVHPPDLYEELKRLPGLSYKEMGWDFELEKKILQGVDQKEYEEWIRFHIKRERHWFEIARHLMRTKPADLTAVMFDGVDKIQHICWRFLDPAWTPAAPSAWERTITDLCHQYFRELDSYVAELIGMADPDSRVFMASDHGFGASTQIFRVNAWLHEQGYLTWRDPGLMDEEAKKSWERRLDSNFVILDWENTKAYARTTSSNGIYIRRSPGPGRPGIPAHEYEPFRRGLIEKLLQIVNPDTGRRVISGALTREEAFPGTQSSHAPDLTLVLSDNGFVSIKNITPVVQSRQEVAGTHRPEGIFMAGGPGVKKGDRLPAFAIAGMAPLLLHSLGLEIPADFEERLPQAAFEPSWLRAHPVRLGEKTRSPESPHSGRGPAPEESEDPVVLERLKALGYIE